MYVSSLLEEVVLVKQDYMRTQSSFKEEKGALTGSAMGVATPNNWSTRTLEDNHSNQSGSH